MNRAKNDLVVTAESTEQNTDTPIVELNELQLALVGGGNGDTILH